MGFNPTCYDVLIKNGTVWDPSTGVKEKRNVGIYGSRIADVFEPDRPKICGSRVIDAEGKYRIPLGKLIFLAAQGAAAFPGSSLVARRRNSGSPDGEKPLRGKGLRARRSGSGVVAGGGAARARKMSKFA